MKISSLCIINKMKVRLEVSCLATTRLSGVSHYTKLLGEALDSHKSISLECRYFNFLNRQPHPNISTTQQAIGNPFVPLRVYAKAQSYGIAPAFDLLQKPVDLTIFPNFATWPTTTSRVCATVVHDLTYLYHPDVVEDKNLVHLQRVVPRSIREADFIITVSEAVKSELVREFSLDPRNCVVTTIPPDKSFYARCSQQTITAVRKKYDTPTEDYILFLGNLEPRKNLTTLIHAYRLLPETIRAKYSLILAGAKGWKTEATQREIDAAIEAGEQIKHVGFIDQDDRPALYQGASVFVMPSLYEGFGMPILEALASNTPVIASDIPVLREAGGDVIHYAPPQDPAAFAAQIQEVLQAETQVSEDRVARHLASFSWQKNAAAIYQKTQELLEQ